MHMSPVETMHVIIFFCIQSLAAYPVALRAANKRVWAVATNNHYICNHLSSGCGQPHWGSHLSHKWHKLQVLSTPKWPNECAAQALGLQLAGPGSKVKSHELSSGHHSLGFRHPRHTTGEWVGDG